MELVQAFLWRCWRNLRLLLLPAGAKQLVPRAHGSTAAAAAKANAVDNAAAKLSSSGGVGVT